MITCALPVPKELNLYAHYAGSGYSVTDRIPYKMKLKLVCDEGYGVAEFRG